MSRIHMTYVLLDKGRFVDEGWQVDDENDDCFV
jgi:hypothetical protein